MHQNVGVEICLSWRVGLPAFSCREGAAAALGSGLVGGFYVPKQWRAALADAHSAEVHSSLEHTLSAQFAEGCIADSELISGLLCGGRKGKRCHSGDAEHSQAMGPYRPDQTTCGLVAMRLWNPVWLFVMQTLCRQREACGNCGNHKRALLPGLICLHFVDHSADQLW